MAKRSFFPTLQASIAAGVTVLGLLGFSAQAQDTSAGAQAQTAPAATAQATPAQATSAQATPAQIAPAQTTTPATDANGQPVQNATTTSTFHRGKKPAPAKSDKVVQTKDTKRFAKKDKTAASLVGVDAKLPDKQLYDKAIIAMNKGHFDIARLDLQTMLNTYPDSQYQMRAKLAIADSWYKEGGTAALTQAESEYADFRVFFPNAPEAAEAQMRIGDIYFRQMDKPDRDYAKATHAEEEYRRMLTDYPNADPKLTAQAKQRLRDVQEVMATREADIASYYATRENWAAVIARYQTVADTYPLYSHMDDVLIGLGDAYEAQARYVRTLKMPPSAEAGKAKLEQLYDGIAADYYRKVVLEHSAAPHVEDARERLDAMHLPIPTPTADQVAASVALENSRSTYTFANMAKLLIMHTPDTVLASHSGEPTMTDPKATVAPTIIKRSNEDFKNAFAPAAAEATGTSGVVAVAPAAAAESTKPAEAAAPLAFNPVSGAGDSTGGGTPSTLTAAPAAGGGGGGNRLGVEILGSTPEPATAADPNALKSVGPANATPLPPTEKAASAPDQLNDIQPGDKTPAAQAVPAKGKAPKTAFDKADESSSKHKKKKGLKKLDPLPQ